jgi:hypothetical protein
MIIKWSNEEVTGYIDREGLGYAILHGLSARSMEDEKLTALWKAAEKALLDVEKYLGI